MKCFISGKYSELIEVLKKKKTVERTFFLSIKSFVRKPEIEIIFCDNNFVPKEDPNVFPWKRYSI